MDATDHENIPSPSHNSSLSSWMHIGFDYINPKEKSESSEIKAFHKEIGPSVISSGYKATGLWQPSDEMNHKSVSVKDTTKYVPDIQRQSVTNAVISAGLEANRDSASSTNSTPATTPQGSPTMKRKIDPCLPVVSSQSVPPVYNPITWIYKGIFSQGTGEMQSYTSKANNQLMSIQEESDAVKTDGKSKSNSHAFPLPLGSRKKYVISNFDINALSPSSW